MGRIKTVTMLLLLLILSVAVMPVKMPTVHAFVPATIQGYIIDKSYEAYTQRIRTNGKVYAVEVNTGVATTVYVSANNGSYKFTDLKPGTYQLTASAGWYWATNYAYINTTLPYTVTVTEGKNLTNINIPLTRGCKLAGFLRYIDAGSSQPIRAIAGNQWLRAAGITWLNYTVEAYDLKGRLMGAYNSSFQGQSAEDATTSPFTITGTRYAGLDVGTYQLKPFVFGYVNRTNTLFTATYLGTTYSSIYIDCYTGGIISGTIAFVSPQGFPETPKAATDASGAVYGGNVAVNVFDTSGALRGAYIHRWTASTLYAHQETTTIGSYTFYLLNYDSAEKAGTTLSADISTAGRELWGQFVYPLTGISSIPASTWTFYYRAWVSDAAAVARCNVDLIIRKSDGTIRETIAPPVPSSGDLAVAAQTLFVNYDWNAYTVVDQTDYLEIDYYCEVITPQPDAYAYLRIDDNALAFSDQTRVININPTADDMSTTLRFYVLGFSEFYNKTYTGRSCKDYGLPDGLYMVRVSIRGYLQKGIATDTATISNGGNTTIRVTMTRGGAIITTIYSMAGDSHILWQYPNSIVRVDFIGLGSISMGLEQDSSVDRFVLRFCGLDFSVSDLQSGYLPYGLDNGNYKLRLFTSGYVQPTDVYATIVTGSKTDTVILAQLGGIISGRVIFKTQDIPKPLSEAVTIYVRAFDAGGALKGESGWSATADSSDLAFSIWGLGYFPEYGLDAGTYTVKLHRCYGDTVEYMQVANVTVTLDKLGSTAYNVTIIAHEMGRVYGTIKTSGALGQLVPLEGVRVSTSTREGGVIEYTSGTDGGYSLNLPVNRTNVNQPIKYNVTFGKYYFINQTIPVETYSGKKDLQNVVLAEVPEFPIGAAITLTLAYGLISWLLYTIKKGAKQAKIFRKKEPPIKH